MNGSEEKFVFIFVNPKSGANKGRQLTELKVQNFRIKARMNIQVQIYDVTNGESKAEGISYIKELQNESGPQLHVWSGGGDGTIVGIIEELVKYKVDVDRVLFSCIPFGTGNDFSQAMGWGKTVEELDILGPHLSTLEHLILERLDSKTSTPTALDVWQVDISAFEGGYIEKVTKEESKHEKEVSRKMCVYFALGVQGFVGSGFEINRKKSRFFNFFVYFIESLKWVAFRKFPSVTALLSSITLDGETVLQCHSSKSSTDSSPTNSTHNVSDCGKKVPSMNQGAIELVVQNIPRIWSRDADLWAEADELTGPNVIQNRTGPTSAENWNPQSTNDGKLEVFGITSMRNYIKLQLPKRKSPVLRIGQFGGNLTLHFDDKAPPPKHRNSFRRFFRQDVPAKGEDKRITYIMLDGEFFKLFRPKSINFSRFRQIQAMAGTVENSRVARDELGISSSPQ